MAAAQGPHHGPAAHPGSEQGRTHAVPQTREGHRPGGNAADSLSLKAGRAQGREVAPHTPALLQGERRIPQRLEDAGEVVRDRTLASSDSPGRLNLARTEQDRYRSPAYTVTVGVRSGPASRDRRHAP